MELHLPDEETMLELARRRSGGHPVGEEIGQRDLAIIRESKAKAEIAAFEDTELLALEKDKAEAEKEEHDAAARVELDIKLEDEHKAHDGNT